MNGPLPDALLAGPRGRRFCFEVAEAIRPSLWPLRPSFASQPLSSGVRTALAAELGRVDAGVVESLDLIAPLMRAVGTARYWQPPDEDDVILNTPEILTALRPIAEAVAVAAGTSWWGSPLPLDAQRYVRWMDDSPSDPLLASGIRERLGRWRAATVADEARADGSMSGPWWSTPALAHIPASTRALPGLGPVRLALVEDGFGWAEARVSEVAIAENARLFEISGPADWAVLAERYPLDVRHSRASDWYDATGENGDWIIPDWAAIADDYDGVHLTLWGYLTTAGRALPVSGGATVLAGWDPDLTYWLSDDLLEEGEAESWMRVDDTWMRA